MRVLLIAYDNATYMTFFPQGLAYIAEAIRGAGHDVEIYHQNIYHYPKEHLRSLLDKERFDVVGVGIIGGYWPYKKLIEISKIVNNSKNRPFYIIAGHGPTPEPEYFLKKTQADVCVMGEGEITIVELLDKVSNKQPLNDVLGIAWRGGSNVNINNRRPLIQDIDSIPFPAYDLFPIEIYRLRRAVNAGPTDFVMYVLSGRGCTFKCNFCYRMDKGHRQRSATGIIEEIRTLKKDYGITYIMFNDELLMVNEERTMHLCEEFIKADIDVKWWCNGRLNYAKLNVLQLMKKAGCVFINYGIESFNNDMMKVMKKGLTTKIIVEGIKNTYDAGISPGFNIIWGNIGETVEHLQNSVNFLLEHDRGDQKRTIRPVAPYPGSPLYYYAIEKGLLDPKEPANDFYENKHLNSDLLTVNFTYLTDDEFYEALRQANITLLTNYNRIQLNNELAQVNNLYKKKDTNFRGFRPIG